MAFLLRAGVRRRAPGLFCAAPAAAAAPLHTSALALQQGAAAAKKKPAAGGAAAAAPVEKYDLKTQIPVNLMKEGDEPTYKPDAAYPPWLWGLLEEKPLIDDLLMKGVENLSQPELKTVLRASSKRRIKSANAASEKTSGE
jgi:hypothetical protein